MSKVRPTQLAIIFIAVILVLAALQSYRIKSSGMTFSSKLEIDKTVREQLDIDRKQSKEITEYIMINNINIDYINKKSSDNENSKTIEIYDTNSKCHVIMVDNNYHILNKQ